MDTAHPTHKSDEISLKELILNTRKWVRYVFSKWKVILAFLIIGAIAGYLYAKAKVTLYRAESTFVLDEGKSNGSALSGLAFLGMDMENASAGLFSSAKNIIWLYKSKLMLHQTLLTPVPYKGKQQLLIDIFLQENGIKEKVIDKEPSLKNLRFTEHMEVDSLDKNQSSIMLSCIGLLKEDKYLDVSETSKAENLITVTFKSKDEAFSKLFTEMLVNNVNQYYISTKTKKTQEEIKVLERKADSARMMLNTSMYQVASSTEAVPYANPLKTTLRVAPEQKRVDVQALSAMYIELAKNLETRRMALAQETPLIQIIDAPAYPLEVLQASGTKFAIIGAFLFAFVTTAVIILRKWYLNVLRS